MAEYNSDKYTAQGEKGEWLRQLRRWWPCILALSPLAIALSIIPYRFERLAVLAVVAVTVAHDIFTHEQGEASKRQ